MVLLLDKDELCPQMELVGVEFPEVLQLAVFEPDKTLFNNDWLVERGFELSDWFKVEFPVDGPDNEFDPEVDKNRLGGELLLELLLFGGRRIGEFMRFVS